MNIIFDLGNVVLNWDPVKLISDVFPDPFEQKTVVNKLLYKTDWSKLDKGTLSYKDAVEIAHSKTKLPKLKLRKLLDEIPKGLTPKPETLELIQELKKDNHKLYVLSNMFSETADDLENRYSFWDLFDGIVFSARIKMIKPSPEIYQYMLKRFNLKAEETIFMDDLKDNVDAAIKEGIKGIHFKSAEQARAELGRLLVDYDSTFGFKKA